MAEPSGTPLTSPSGGPAVDGRGVPVVDPSKNVLDLVHAAIKRTDDITSLQASTEREYVLLHMQRQDDLRVMAESHLKTLLDVRSEYERLLMEKEAKRLNDIRAVDVNAVAEASRVATAQATTLATQVATSAETLRTQVATVATATATALTNALEPLQKSIEDLRKTQYSALGERVAKDYNRDGSQWLIGVGIGIMVLIINVGLAVVLHFIPAK